MFFAILINMILLINLSSEVLDIRADLYYYNEVNGDDDGRE